MRRSLHDASLRSAPVGTTGILVKLMLPRPPPLILLVRQPFRRLDRSAKRGVERPCLHQ